MPVYEYKAGDKKRSCEKCAEVFEITHSMAEAPLKKCPECGAPIERVFSTFGVGTLPSDKSRISDKNLKKHGFTKLVNEGNGKFRKTV